MLHLYTLDRGRVGAVAKGVRKTKSRFGARLEPLSPRRAHPPPGQRRAPDGHRRRADPLAPRDARGRRTGSASGSSAPRRCCGSSPSRRRTSARSRRSRDSSTSLDELEPASAEPRRRSTRSSLSFQLKLLWLSGYLPHLTSCAECGADEGALRLLARRRAAPSAARARTAGGLPLSRDGLAAIDGLLRRPLDDARDGGLTERGAREALAVDHGARTSTTAASACGRCARLSSSIRVVAVLDVLGDELLERLELLEQLLGRTSRSGGVEPSSQGAESTAVFHATSSARSSSPSPPSSASGSTESR